MKPNKYIAGILSLALIGSACYPSVHVNGESKAEVIANTDKINVREGAGLSYPVADQIHKGDSFTIVSREGDWIEIKLGRNKTGWVADWLVTEKKNSTVKEKSDQATINTNNVRLRSGPGTSFQIIGSLNKNSKIEIIETNQNWISIISGNTSGWVASEYVDASSAMKEPNVKKERLNASGVNLTENLNVRSNPSTNARVLGKLNKNAKVTIQAKSGEWAEISFKGENGWVNMAYLALNGEQKAVVTADKLSVRKSASLNSDIISSVEEGNTFTILEEKNNMSKINYSGDKIGWVASWFLETQTPSTEKVKTEATEELNDSSIVILHDGTNLRSKPNVDSKIVARANKNETFPITAIEGDWYKIKLKNGETAYIAGWIVSVKGEVRQVERAGAGNVLSGKIIVLDPGHGGRDQGTLGFGGTQEKDLTLKTALLLRDKLEAAGANVIMTRTGDSFLQLPSRVRISHANAADAFISIHYDSTTDQQTSGITSYYYHSYQQTLAKQLNESLSSALQIKNRGFRYGDYHVLRENNRAAVLLELGFLSNPAEEVKVTSSTYQELVSNAIYTGLIKYIK